MTNDEKKMTYRNAVCGDCEVTKSQEPITKNEALVSLGVYKQVAWERDIAIQLLHELGYEFGQKIVPTTKNDLGVDCISRDEVCRYVAEFVNHEYSTREEEELIDNIITGIERMPSVTPQEPQTFRWCTDCREYDQEKHCCHRFSKVIRDTVEEMKQEQEPMQVDLEGDGYADGELVYDYGKCPKCGWFLEESDKDWKEPYCCHCGQKLKWLNNEAENDD